MVDAVPLDPFCVAVNERRANTLHMSKKSVHRPFAAAMLAINLCFLLIAAPVQAQQPRDQTPKKTGTLKDGETCEQLPCSCGNVSATAVGCKCSLTDSIGPSSGVFTCPPPVVSTGALLGGALVLGLLGVAAYRLIRVRGTGK